MFDMIGHERATRSATFKGNERAGESGCGCGCDALGVGAYGTIVRFTHGLSRYSRTCDTKTASPEISLQNAVG
jgi:hypothetical protein